MNVNLDIYFIANIIIFAIMICNSLMWWRLRFHADIAINVACCSTIVTFIGRIAKLPNDRLDYYILISSVMVCIGFTVNAYGKYRRNKSEN